MFEKFKYERLPLSLIKLDERNPRIVTPQRPKSEDEIIRYFFEHADLTAFIKKIVTEGRNQGAEQPYVIKTGKEYTVIEGNTRIATYKLLTGQLTAPNDFTRAVLPIPNAVKDDLLSVACAIAPNRDALLPIMANSHFGLGDKSRWGFLGSRKAVYDERAGGKSISQLANVFARTQSEIKDLILEYELYLATLKFDWTEAEQFALMDPGVAFNPPIRFLETTGHRTSVGVEFDKTNLTVDFVSDEARRRLKHLIKKLVVTPQRGLGATATYAEVFKDYAQQRTVSKTSGGSGQDPSVTESAVSDAGQGVAETGLGAGDAASGQAGGTSVTPGRETGGPVGSKPRKNALLDYPVTIQNRLLTQFMKEARKINIVEFPAAGTSLLRGIVEAVCKNIIEKQGANSSGKQNDLEGAINLCLSNTVKLGADDKIILKQFKNNHLANLNLATHANVIPNHHLLTAARDTIELFVMRNI